MESKEMVLGTETKSALKSVPETRQMEILFTCCIYWISWKCADKVSQIWRV